MASAREQLEKAAVAQRHARPIPAADLMAHVNVGQVGNALAPPPPRDPPLYDKLENMHSLLCALHDDIGRIECALDGSDSVEREKSILNTTPNGPGIFHLAAVCSMLVEIAGNRVSNIAAKL